MYNNNNNQNDVDKNEFIGFLTILSIFSHEKLSSRTPKHIYNHIESQPQWREKVKQNRFQSTFVKNSRINGEKKNSSHCPNRNFFIHIIFKCDANQLITKNFWVLKKLIVSMMWYDEDKHSHTPTDWLLQFYNSDNNENI